MIRFRAFIFRLFEKRQLRNWFYTIAFVIFVPVGYRFAALAWRYGSWVDKPLAGIAGLFIGITMVVTLVRFWNVPPQQVTPSIASNLIAMPKPAELLASSLANEFIAAVRRRAAENRAMATGAGALGSTTGKSHFRF